MNIKEIGNNALAALGLAAKNSKKMEKFFNLFESTGDDTDAINELLEQSRINGGGVVRGAKDAIFKISAPLVVGSNTTLDIPNLVLLEGSESHMVTNYSSENPVATGLGSIANGENIITTELGATAEIGQSIELTDAAANGNGKFIGIISETTDTTITVVEFNGEDYLATNTVTDVELKLFNRDSNIKIIGENWDRGTNGPNGSTGIPESAVDGHSVYLKHVDNFSVELDYVHSDGGVSFVWPTSCSNFDITIKDGDCVRTLCQVVGPIYKARIHLVAGKSTDDMINICGNVYPDQTETCGPVRDVTVYDLQGKPAGASCLKLNCGQGLIIDGVKVVGHIGGTATVGLFIGEDTAYPETTGGEYKNIDVGTVDAYCTGSLFSFNNPVAKDIKGIFHFNGTNNPSFIQGDTMEIGKLQMDVYAIDEIATPIKILTTGANLDDVEISGHMTPSVDGHFIQVGDSAGGPTINRLTLKGCTFKSSATVNGSLIRMTDGLVNILTVKDCYVEYDVSDNNKNAIFSTGGTIEKLKISGYFKNNVAIVRNDADIPVEDIELDNVVVDTCDRMLNIRADAKITLGNVKCIDGPSPHIFISGGNVELYGNMPDFDGGNTFLLQLGASELVYPYSFNLRLQPTLISGDRRTHFFDRTLDTFVAWDGSAYQSII
ncbi:MAG: hypothetical protein ACQ5SW_08395 [Sphaerochaetaceae bacterium]